MTARGEAHDRQQALADHLRSTGLIRSRRVEAAFRAVSRHLFLPHEPLDRAYADEAIPTKRIQGVPVSSSSQPSMMAIMLEQLDLQPGQHVLEIGAGTGYNAALMAHIIGKQGQVTAVDIDQDIVDNARAHLATAGFSDVRVVLGDGARGYPEVGPYDRIVLTVAAGNLSPAWRDQLKPDGLLLVPLHIRTGIQKVTAFRRRDQHLESLSVRGGSFMPLRGESSWDREHLVQLAPGLSLTTGSDLRVDPVALRELLSAPGDRVPSEVEIGPRDVLDGLDLWIALHDARACLLHSHAGVSEQDSIPWLVEGTARFRLALGLLDDSGMALLSPPGEQGAPPVFKLWVRSYGQSAELAGRLVELVRAWAAAGRPTSPRLRIRAYFDNAPGNGESALVVLRSRSSTLVLDWPR